MATSKDVIPAKALHRTVYRAKAGIQKRILEKNLLDTPAYRQAGAFAGITE